MARAARNVRDRKVAKAEDTNQPAYAKRTGSKVKESYDTYVEGVKVNVDRTVVTGWNYSNRYGLVKLIAVPAKMKDSQDYLTSNSKFVKMIVKVKHPGPVLPLVTNGFWDGTTLFIPDMEMIARPSAPNGGYFGTNYNSDK